MLELPWTLKTSDFTFLQNYARHSLAAHMIIIVFLWLEKVMVMDYLSDDLKLKPMSFIWSELFTHNRQM